VVSLGVEIIDQIGSLEKGHGHVKSIQEDLDQAANDRVVDGNERFLIYDLVVGLYCGRN